MTPETLVCADNIAPERLSALRDDALAPSEAQRLRDHIANCPACAARLADYDMLAAALRSQRELEPGERIVNGVRARLPAHVRAREWRRPSRRLWTGLATLAPVAAIILLFIYVFSGLAGRGRPATTATPTVRGVTPSATTANGKTIAPTTTPALVTLPAFTSSVSADVAWGTLTPTATFQTPPGADTQFAVSALSPDGGTLAGTSMYQSATPGASGAPRVDLVSYDVASRAWEPLGPHWNGYVGPWGQANAVSARYIVYGYNSQAGATCGVCHNTLWAYDRQTGASWEIEPGKQGSVQYDGDLRDLTSDDHVAFTSAEGQVWVADLAARRVTLALPPGAQPASATVTAPQPSVRLDGFSWPNIIYDYTPPAQADGSPVATTLRVTNLQTNSTLILTPPLNALFGAQSAAASLGVSWAGVSGDTLYLITTTQLNGVDAKGAAVSASYGTLYRVSNVLTHPGAPEMLARWPMSQVAQDRTSGVFQLQTANNRLITLGSGYTWDLRENRLVQLPAQYVSAGSGTGALLSGDYLMLTYAISSSNPQAPIITGAIYDTRSLPIR